MLITVSPRTVRVRRVHGGFFRGTQFSLMDVAIACEHLSLQAAELGLGTCMFGWLDEKAVKRELSLAEGTKIDLMMSLGYPPDEDCLPPKKRKSLEEIRRYL